MKPEEIAVYQKAEKEPIQEGDRVFHRGQNRIFIVESISQMRNLVLVSDPTKDSLLVFTPSELTKLPK